LWNEGSSMKSPSYIIKALSRYYPSEVKSISYIEIYFHADSNNETRWIRSGSAEKFYTVKHAVEYAKNNKAVEKRPTLGADTMPWIEGPRGGRYSIFTGRLLK
jgi:hypothetical protein